MPRSVTVLLRRGGLGLDRRSRLRCGLGYGRRRRSGNLKGDLVAAIGIELVIPVQARAGMLGNRDAGTCRLQRTVGLVALPVAPRPLNMLSAWPTSPSMVQRSAHVEHGDGMAGLFCKSSVEVCLGRRPVPGKRPRASRHNRCRRCCWHPAAIKPIGSTAQINAPFAESLNMKHLSVGDRR